MRLFWAGRGASLRTRLLALSLAALVPGFTATRGGTPLVAVSLGGILLVYMALRRVALETGPGLAAAFVAWRGTRPITAAALLPELVRLLAAHAAAFREPLQSDGWALRRALHARLSQLFRRATLEPAAAFIFLALSALDCERLRGELLRRAVFPRLPLAP